MFLLYIIVRVLDIIALLYNFVTRKVLIIFDFHFRRVEGAPQDTCYRTGVVGLVGLV